MALHGGSGTHDGLRHALRQRGPGVGGDVVAQHGIEIGALCLSLGVRVQRAAARHINAPVRDARRGQHARVRHGGQLLPARRGVVHIEHEDAIEAAGGIRLLLAAHHIERLIRRCKSRVGGRAGQIRQNAGGGLTIRADAEPGRLGQVAVRIASARHDHAVGSPDAGRIADGVGQGTDHLRGRSADLPQGNIGIKDLGPAVSRGLRIRLGLREVSPADHDDGVSRFPAAQGGSGHAGAPDGIVNGRSLRCRSGFGGQGGCQGGSS